jgi:hypothetical protein
MRQARAQLLRLSERGKLSQSGIVLDVFRFALYSCARRPCAAEGDGHS